MIKPFVLMATQRKNVDGKFLIYTHLINLTCVRVQSSCRVFLRNVIGKGAPFTQTLVLSIYTKTYGTRTQHWKSALRKNPPC